MVSDAVKQAPDYTTTLGLIIKGNSRDEGEQSEVNILIAGGHRRKNKQPSYLLKYQISPASRKSDEVFVNMRRKMPIEGARSTVAAKINPNQSSLPGQKETILLLLFLFLFFFTSRNIEPAFSLPFLFVFDRDF